MKYVIFACLLTLTGFAALNHETSQKTVAEIELQLPIESLKFYQDYKPHPTVLTQSFESTPMIKFARSHQGDIDTVTMQRQNMNGG